MNDSMRRTAAGLMALVVLWILVYWWWPSEPRISFAQPPETEASDTAATRRSSEPIDEPQQSAEDASAPGLVSPAQDGRERPNPAPPQPAPPPIATKIIPPEFIEHTVERGETFGSISRRYFGSPKHASDIARANPLLDPARLRPGRVIRVPKDPTNVQGKPADPPPVPAGGGSTPVGEVRSYTVVPGDTLSKISTKMYGSPNNSDLIFEANRALLDSPDDLSVGQVLRIPPGPR